MKDRIVQYPNRYRLTQVSEDVYDLTPEPGAVTEAGDPINVATLLKNQTAAQCGLGANALPDDVLWKLVTSGNKKQYFLTAGTFTFTAPKTGLYLVEVAGAGGAYSGSGGTVGGCGGGYALKIVFLTKGQQIAVTVGDGVTANSQAGGTSSFGSYVSATGGLGYGTLGNGIGGSININGGKGNIGASGGSGGTPLCSPGSAECSGPGSGGGGVVPKSAAGAVIVEWIGYEV